jgi:hypothetical protein
LYFLLFFLYRMSLRLCLFQYSGFSSVTAYLFNFRVPCLIVACLLVLCSWIDSFYVYCLVEQVAYLLICPFLGDGISCFICYCSPYPPCMCLKWARSPVCNCSSWRITAKNAFLICMQLKERTKEGCTRERIKIVIGNAFLSRFELGDMESRLRRTVLSCMLPYVTLIFSSHYHVLSVVPGFRMPQMITVFLTRLWMGSYFMDVCVPK